MELFLDKLQIGEKQKIMLHYGRIIDNILDSKKHYLKHFECASFEVSWKWEEYENVFNAKSEKIKNAKDKYIVILFVYTPARLEEYLKSKKIKRNYYNMIINTILEFIIGHEIFHIAFGHCTLSDNEKDELDNSVKRKFENMCDLKSIDSMFPLLDLYIKEGKSNVVDGYASLLASLFIYFKILESNTLVEMEEILKHNEEIEREKSIQRKKKYKSVTSTERTHPFVTIRFDNICRQIEHHLRESGCSEQYVDGIYKKSVEYLNAFNFKEELEIKPYYRRNNKAQKRDLDIDYDEMCNYVRKTYIH